MWYRDHEVLWKPSMHNAFYLDISHPLQIHLPSIFRPEKQRYNAASWVKWHLCWCFNIVTLSRGCWHHWHLKPLGKWGGGVALDFKPCPAVVMLDALISVPSLVAGTLAWTHMPGTARWLAKRTGRKGSAFYSYFCLTDNKITCRPKWQATSLSSCQSPRSTIWY